MKIENVLVTDGHYFHTVGIVRYLGKRDLNVFVIGNTKLALVAHSKYCKDYFTFPPPYSSKYLPYLEKLVKQLNIDIIIPVGYQSTLEIARQKERLQKLTRIEIADVESIELALNKKRTYEFAQRIGVPYPKTLYPTDIKDIEGMAKQIEYPLIIKGLYEAGGNIVSIVRDRNELVDNYVTICEQNNFKPGSLPMLQEYMAAEDQHFTICLLYQNGKCKRLFVHHRIRKGTRFGTIACGETKIKPSIYDQIKTFGTRLLDNLNWHGAAGIEFRKDHKEGVLKLMEINPKLWASIDLALFAGINFPYHICEMAAGKKLNYSEEYNHNLKFHFPLSRELFQFKWNPKSMPNYILDVLNPKVKSNIMLSDLKPNCIEFSNTLVSLLLPEKVKSLLKRILGI